MEGLARLLVEVGERVAAAYPETGVRVSAAEEAAVAEIRAAAGLRILGLSGGYTQRRTTLEDDDPPSTSLFAEIAASRASGVVPVAAWSATVTQ